MLFNSYHFVLLFFPIVLITYFALPDRLRWGFLLGASCYFYMSFLPVYILILLITIVVDYFSGIWIPAATGRKKTRVLAGSIVVNVGMLAVFKYWNFAATNLNSFAQAIHWNYSLALLSFALPIGLSFHTFQSMSYTIEVYRGNYPPERNFCIFALYVLFFPQLVAGPIERPQNLLHQFHERHGFDYDRVVSGLRLMFWGFIQKMVVADRLAPIVDQVYSEPRRHTGFELVFATVLFAFQILCDFAGYSDIAIGAARVMGFKLMRNFRQPYLAQSVTEFWGRWHISLSSWFRDYLYIPLGGNRVGRLRRWVNVLTVFMVSGLWHGANWTYVIWGGINGFLVVSEDILGRSNSVERYGSPGSAIPAIGRMLWTFLAVCVCWVFFRAKSAGEALFILKRMLQETTSLHLPNIERSSAAIAVILICFVIVMSVARERLSLGHLVDRQPTWVRWPLYAASLAGVLLLAEFSSREFIYFQF